MSELARARIIISGRVQGVFYRHNTNQEANRIGVTGWVRNLPSGEVEAVIEGEKDKVTELIEWCRIGPPYSRVDDVSVNWKQYTGEFSHFTIRY